MNGEKLRRAQEIIYNCPFILLVVFTGLLATPFMGKIGLRKNDNEVPVIQMIEEGKNAAVDRLESLKTNLKTEKTERNSSDVNAASADDISLTSVENVENAGTRKGISDEIENKNRYNNGVEIREEAEKQTREEIHATEFLEYEPIETDSRYYSDAGKIALTTTYDYVLENDSYFNDAAFLGDSRTLGISDYAGLEGADFFCDNGMTIYKLLGDEGVTWQRTGEKVDLKKILQEKQYGKIYIMLGMNELGYGDTLMYLRQYRKVIRQIKEWQPGVIIYVMANLHVSLEKNNMESEFNNININDKNVASARLANGRDIFYLDCNPLFTDEEGYLQAELTFDGVHLYAQHYDKWRAFLMEHGVERAEEEVSDGNEKIGENAAESGDTGKNAVITGEG